jgi:DNA-directed RNA polymerase subunit omega
MLYPAVAPMVDKIGSRYSLVIAAAKRARQISLSAERDEIELSEKPVKMAIIELSNDCINVKSAPVEMSAVLEEAIRNRSMEIEHSGMSYSKDDYDDDGNEDDFDNSGSESDEEGY